jgi:hypothetical protein
LIASKKTLEMEVKVNTLTKSKLFNATVVGVLTVCLALFGVFAYAPTANADAEDANVQSITIKVDGTSIEQSYSKSDLQEATISGNKIMNTTSTLGVEFKKNEGSGSYPWYIMAVKDYVTFDDLFTYAGVSQYWKNGAEIVFTVREQDETTGAYVDREYTKYTFTYSGLQGQNKFYKYLYSDGTFYKNNTAYDTVPTAAIGFQCTSEKISGVASSTLSKLSSGTFAQTTQFVTGLSDETFDLPDGSSGNMGRRLPTSIVGITIYPNGR